MAKYGSNQTAKTIAAVTAATLTWDEKELPEGGVDYFAVELSGANNEIGGTSGIDEVRVKVNQIPLIRLRTAQMAALVEAISPSNDAYADGDLRFTIPGKLPGVQGMGFPLGRMEVNIDLNAASSSAGDARIAWQRSDAPPVRYLSAVSTVTNVAASSTNARINISRSNGLLWGLMLPLVGATGITRARVVISGVELLNLRQSAMLELMRYTNPGSVTANFVLRMPSLLPLGEDSYVEVDTGAASAATDQYAPVLIHSV